jgi:hypothetical protein
MARATRALVAETKTAMEMAVRAMAIATICSLATATLVADYKKGDCKGG